MSLVNLLITITVFGTVVYVIMWLVGYLNFPEPIRKAVVVIVVLIAVLWILGTFLPGTHLPWAR